MVSVNISLFYFLAVYTPQQATIYSSPLGETNQFAHDHVQDMYQNHPFNPPRGPPTLNPPAYIDVPNPNLAPPSNQPQLPPSQDELISSNPLFKVLGIDLSSSWEAHASAYEENKKRWSTCSIEEWRAGSVGMLHVLNFQCEVRVERKKSPYVSSQSSQNHLTR